MAYVSSVLSHCKKFYFAPSLAFLGEGGEINRPGASNEQHQRKTTEFEMTSTKQYDNNGNFIATTSPMRISKNNVDEEENERDLTSGIINDSTLPDAITWKGILQTNRQLYDIASWTGIIYPVPSQQVRSSGLTEMQIAFRQKWIIFMHIGILILIANFFVTVPFSFLAPYLRHHNESELSSTTEEKLSLYGSFALIAGYIPLFTMLGGMITLRKSIVNDIPLFHRNLFESNSSTFFQPKQVFLEMDYSAIVQQSIARKIPHAWLMIKVMVALTSIYLIFFIIDSIFSLADSGSNNIDGQTNSFITMYFISAILYFASLLGILPNILMIFGLLSFVLVEQRISYFTMLHLRSLAMQSLLTDTDYLKAGKDMNYRDDNSPLNWLFAGAAIDSSFCIITLCIIAFAKDISIKDSIIIIELVILLFSQELTVLFVILYEILCVNEMIDVLLTQTTKQRVVDHNRLMTTFQSFETALLSKDNTKNTNTLVVNREALLLELLKEEEKRVRRLELHLLINENRIGTTILFVYRPSKVQLMVQITSIVIAIASSIMKLIVKAITNQ